MQNFSHNRPKLTLIRQKFGLKRGFFYMFFKNIQKNLSPLQFYIVNLTKTWLGNFLGDFSLSLGDFLTETSGHPVLRPHIWGVRVKN